jgi:hypothetical protein
MSTQTTGTFTLAGWDEKPAGAAEGGAKLAHAVVTNVFSEGIEATATNCVYDLVYVTAKTGVFSGYELVAGALDGRGGSFVLEHRGHFDEEGTVHCALEVVSGSGSGELAGLTGRGGFTAPAGTKEITYTLDYELG